LQTGDIRIQVVAIALANTQAIDIPILIDVARVTLTAVIGFVAAIEGARGAVRASDGLARATAQQCVALLDTVAIDVIRTLRMVGRRTTAFGARDALVEGANDTIVALAIIQARFAQG
jgi:hypothetical protein